ncbi:MAG: YraN family protein [Treponema sp.]|nr:YraN family protein [Treponema sp.]
MIKPVIVQEKKSKDNGCPIFPGRSRQEIGQKGESLAALALQKKGMQVIGRNIRSKSGEIDLAVLDGGVLVFVEVKTWPAYGLENLRFRITPKKQRRIIETAKYFLESHRKYNNRSIRFDVVFLRPREPMVHLVSAFTESP